MAFDMRWTPIAFVIRPAHRKRNNMLNVPSFSNINFTPAYMAFAAMFLK
jgi:hypothetical protein